MTKHPANRFSLVADIGGTNTRVALADGTTVMADTVRRYSNAEFDSLDSVLKRFIADEGDVNCKGACVALAGPVRDGVGTMTNLNWTVDRNSLAAATGAEHVSILNDLQAQGHALGYISADKIRPILPAPEASPHAVRLVVGIGTGFNAAPVYETELGRFVAPSECGHAAIAVRGAEMIALTQALEDKHEFVSVEHLLSGRGLERVYRFVTGKTGTATEKTAAEIMASVKAEDDPKAIEALKLFVRTLATVVGNLGLIQLPFGGIYLVGGVAGHIAPYLTDYGFAEAYYDKGRFSKFMENFPVFVIEDDYAALIGCASHLQKPYS